MSKDSTKSSIWELDVKYAGKTRTAKIAKIRQVMAAKGITKQDILDLEDIAWTLNLRGNYEEHCPVFLSYMVIDEKNITLFANRKDFSEKLIATLQEEGVVFKDYDEGADYAKELRDIAEYDITSPIAFLKAVKNEVEVAGIRQANIKDGVAVTKLLYWLQKNAGKEDISELSIADKVASLRAANEDYLGESFPAIIGYQEHGVIIHYETTKESNASIKPEGMLLIDTGGHYLCGTTDTTRTITLGEPSAQQKKHYTAVLKGNLRLAMARFPKDTKGIELDTIARTPLRDIGLDYAHGTGHGVGFILNVHEGPQRITKQGENATKIAFLEGMITSNEPGVYIENEYGIRLESVTLCSAFGEELGFETLTKVPFDTNLINVFELSKEEKQYLNEYHEEVCQTLSPYLDEEEREWLAKITTKV